MRYTKVELDHTLMVILGERLYNILMHTTTRSATINSAIKKCFMEERFGEEADRLRSYVNHLDEGGTLE